MLKAGFFALAQIGLEALKPLFSRAVRTATRNPVRGSSGSPRCVRTS